MNQQLLEKVSAITGKDYAKGMFLNIATTSAAVKDLVQVVENLKNGKQVEAEPVAKPANNVELVAQAITPAAAKAVDHVEAFNAISDPVERARYAFKHRAELTAAAKAMKISHRQSRR